VSDQAQAPTSANIRKRHRRVLAVGGEVAPKPRSMLPDREEEKPADAPTRDQIYGLGRLLAISDGIFAFALTLLVVQVTVPTLASGSEPGQLGVQLLDQFPIYLSYVLSFAVLAAYWYGHHRIFRYIRRYDARLIMLNFGVLLFVAALPFPTAILGRYGDQPLAVVIYAVFQAATGLFSAVLWWYATHCRQLVSSDLNGKFIWLQGLRLVFPPAVFLLSVPIALWRPSVAEASWCLIWIGIFATDRRLGAHANAQ
jgi:uncharacterized membrane protein